MLLSDMGYMSAERMKDLKIQQIVRSRPSKFEVPSTLAYVPPSYRPKGSKLAERSAKRQGRPIESYRW